MINIVSPENSVSLLMIHKTQLKTTWPYNCIINLSFIRANFTRGLLWLHVIVSCEVFKTLQKRTASGKSVWITVLCDAIQTVWKLEEKIDPGKDGLNICQQFKSVLKRKKNNIGVKISLPLTQPYLKRRQMCGKISPDSK